MEISKTQILSYTHLINCQHSLGTACFIVTKDLCIHLTSIEKLLHKKHYREHVRKGTPADIPLIKSFHSSLESQTFYLNRIDCTMTTNAVERTFKKYIHYYNNIRIQTKLNSQSPINYRQLAVKKCFRSLSQKQGSVLLGMCFE